MTWYTSLTLCSKRFHSWFFPLVHVEVVYLIINTIPMCYAWWNGTGFGILWMFNVTDDCGVRLGGTFLIKNNKIPMEYTLTKGTYDEQLKYQWYFHVSRTLILYSTWTHHAFGQNTCGAELSWFDILQLQIVAHVVSCSELLF